MKMPSGNSLKAESRNWLCTVAFEYHAQYSMPNIKLNPGGVLYAADHIATLVPRCICTLGTPHYLPPVVVERHLNPKVISPSSRLALAGLKLPRHCWVICMVEFGRCHTFEPRPLPKCSVASFIHLHRR